MAGTLRTATGIGLCLAAMVATPAQPQGFGGILNGVLGAQRSRPAQEDRSEEQRQRDDRTAAGAVGCGVGGVLGGLIGSNTGSRILIGSLLCFAGWKLGEALTKRDQERLTARSQELLAQEGPQSEVWTAPESKAQVRLDIGAAEERREKVPFQIDEGVQTPAEDVRIEARTYAAGQRLPFRAKPDAAAAERGFFEGGDQVEVLGRTADGRWLLVGDEGALVGYALASELTPPPPPPPVQVAAPVAPPPAARPARTPRKPAARPAPPPPPRVVRPAAPPPRAKPKVIQRAARQGSQPQIAIRDARLARTRTVSVRASTQCKAVVAQTGSKSDTHRGCALPNGQWAIA